MFKILCSLFVLFISFESIKSQQCQCGTVEISPCVASTMTPFNADLTVNVNLIFPYAQYLKNNGILDVLISAFIGEGASLDLCDRKELVQAWVDAAGPLGLGVIVQIGILPYVDVLELAKFCASLNVKAIVVVPELIYQATTVAEAVADLKRIADVAQISILIEYDVLSVQTTVNIVDFYIAAVAEIPCFAGIITGIEIALEIPSITSVVDKLICVIEHEAIGPAFLNGINVTVTPAANLFPGTVLNIKAAVDAGNIALVRELQQLLNLQVNAVINLDGGSSSRYDRSFIPNHKAALKLIADLDILLPRLPLVEVELDVLTQINDILVNLDVTLLGSVNLPLQIG